MGKDQELLEAARNGNIQVVEKILSQRAKRSGPLASLRRGPGANVQDNSGYSALHHAALNGHKEIVELLLSNEASTNIVDAKGSSPLHLAAWTGNLDIVKTLLYHGPSVPNVNLMTKDNETPLHCAAQYGHTPVVLQLLDAQCDPTVRNSRAETPLDLAAQYGRLESVDALVRAHPGLINAFNSRALSALFPVSPLHLASRNGHRSVVARLLQAGLDVNIRTAAGTALHEAALCGKLEVVKTLLEHGADLRVLDSKHNTVLDILSKFPHVQDISAIVNHYWADTMGGEGLPPIPVPPLGSPYENVKLKFPPSSSSPGPSPSQWEHLRDRRTSGLSASSVKSMDLYHHRGNGHHLTNNSGHARYLTRDTSYFSDDHSSYLHDLDDSVSVCSTASSSASKISPTPPKKPPRRNLSVSPSHLMSDLSVASAVMSYEFLVSGGGSRSVSDTDDMQLPHTPRAHPLRRGKSADHCTAAAADFSRLRYSSTIDIDTPPSPPRGGPTTPPLVDTALNKYPPIALTSESSSGGLALRTTNPKRKLKRLQLKDNSRENEDPTGPALNSLLKRGDLPFKKIDPKEFMPQPITVERILSPSADRSNVSGPNCVRNSYPLFNSRIRVLSNGENHGWPLSPTHYQQPPTPEHPPPTPKQAEQTIHNRIRPLSQEYNNLKRKSRDMETETEDELLMLVFDNSSSSLSSSVSMSERSVQSSQTDTSDVPFAGLLRGSVSGDQNGATASSGCKAERPTSLNQLKSVYEDMPSKSDDRNTGGASVLSPFDEQEEWARISEIMATIGSGLVKESGFVSELEQEFQARLGLSRSGSLTDNVSPLIAEALPDQSAPVVMSSVEAWLESLQLAEHKERFLTYGYDDVQFLNGVLSDADLVDMGVTSATHRQSLLKSAESLPAKVKEVQALIKQGSSDKSDEDQIADWLSSIGLENYVETFRKHLFVEMERIKKIWEVELTAVLEIGKPAHRKRILISLDRLSSGPNLDQIQLKSANKPGAGKVNGMGTETLRRNRKKARPAPPPPPQAKEKLEESKKLKAAEGSDSVELLKAVGGSESVEMLKDAGGSVEMIEPSDPLSRGTEEKSSSQSLVNGSVTYLATYLGSTVVKEKSMESSKQSIQKMKQSKSEESQNNPEILFSISLQGVKFLNPKDKSLICEHEMRNIHCACQDPQDLAYFSYITKDFDSGAHFSHIFFVKNASQVVQIILTLSQALDNASTLRKSLKSSPGHARSRSMNQVTPGTPPSVQHSRSLSVHEGNYLNGGSIDIQVGKAPIACSEEL